MHSPKPWVAGLVVVHLVISIVHGLAHDGARVPMSTAANAFVFVVILAGPIAGLVLTRWSPPSGNWLIAVTLLASLIFGVVNHFVLVSPDHVGHVASDWRVLFGATAVLLAISEGLGAGVAIAMARKGRMS
jgi:hypothetical protein